MGDFYFVWLTCCLELEDVDSPLARNILQAMEKRKSKLFDNNAFLAAIYLDPRINYRGSELITQEQRATAKVNDANESIFIFNHVFNVLEAFA